MNKRGNVMRWKVPVGLVCLLSVAVGVPTAGAADVETLLRAIPGDLPIAVVVKNLDEFDRNVVHVVARFDPERARKGFVAELKAKLPFGDRIDFTQPMALCQVSTDSPDESLIFVVVPDFEQKIRDIEGAIKTGDVWQLSSHGGMVFVRSRGPFVAAATTESALAALDSESVPLFAKLGANRSFLESRDAFLHFDLYTVRDFLVNAMAQSMQKVPELGANLNVQLGVDIATATGLIGMVIDTLHTFLQQVSVIDLAMSVDRDAIDTTVFAYFHDGPISTYLKKQQPGTGRILADLPNAPFILAGGYECADHESKFLDFVLERSIAAAGLSGDPVTTEAFRASSTLKHDMFDRIARTGFALSTSGLSMHVAGYYDGRDGAALIEAVKKAAEHQSSPSGDTGSTSPQRRIGDVVVQEFSLAPDPSKPQPVFLSPLYGPDTRYAFAQREGRVDYAIGNAAIIEKRFSAGPAASLADNAAVNSTLAKLPAQGNLALLIDPSGVLPLVGPLLGVAAPPIGEPLSPIGVVATLSQHPARIDLHIPLRTITALAPPKPAKEPS